MSGKRLYSMVDELGEIRTYRKKRGGVRAYEAEEDHRVFSAGANAVGIHDVLKGYFVIVDEFDRAEKVLPPEMFHKVYELQE